MVFCSVEEAVKELRKGKVILVVDDEERENEGDLVAAGEFIDSEKVNFFLKKAGGLLCTPIDDSVAKQFNLNLINKPTDKFQTPFTVSIDAKQGVSTGVSASDRAKTIQTLCNENAGEDSFNKPGHLFPLLAKEGGVLERAGHTEATIDLLKFANLKRVGVICEVMLENGEMARLPDLQKLAEEFDLKILTIESLIKHRIEKENLVEKTSETVLPTEFGEFKAVAFQDKLHGDEYIALLKGDVSGKENVLVRVHSGCVTGDVFHSEKCDCHAQLHAAMELIQKDKEGVLLYIPCHEGRGIGLFNKIKAYELQEKGMDTVEANEALGLKADLRDYGIGAQILRKLGLSSIRLLSNNPKKIVGLQAYGLKITKNVSLKGVTNKHNEEYLKTKKSKLGHLL